MPIDLYGPSEGLDPAKEVAGLDLYAPDPNKPGAFKRGLGAGIAGVKSSLYGAGALAARGAGAILPAAAAPITQGLEAAALENVRAQNEIAASQSMRYEDVLEDPTRAAEYFKFLLGQAVPSLATMAVGGGLGALAGRAVAGQAGMAAARAAGVVAPAVRAGALTGAVLPDVALEAGSIFPEAVKEGVESPGTRALVGGAVAGALDFVPLLAAEKYLKPIGKGGFGAMARGAAKGAPVGAALEGSQEMLQSLVERAAAGKSLTDPEAVSDYIESFMGGAAPGSIFGGAIGARRQSTAPVQETPPSTNTEQPPEVNDPNLSTIVPDLGTATPAEQFAYFTQQHTAATQQLATLEPAVAAAQQAHDAAVARREELTAEAKLPIGERRTMSEITVEKKAIAKQIEAAKKETERLGGELYNTRATIAGLTPQLEAAQRLIASSQSESAGVIDQDLSVPNVVVPDEGLNPAIAPKTEVPASDVVATSSAPVVTEQEHINRAVVGVQTLMRERGMLHDLPASKLGGDLTPRELAIERQGGRGAVKGPNSAQMAAIEDHAMAVIEPIAMALAKTKTDTPGGQAKIAKAMTVSMRGVVQEAAKLQSVEAAQAHIEAKMPAALKGHGVQIDAPDMAKAVSAAVGQAKTQYSKGATDAWGLLADPAERTKNRTKVTQAAKKGETLYAQERDGAWRPVAGPYEVDGRVIRTGVGTEERGVFEKDSLRTAEFLPSAESNAALTQDEFDTLPEPAKFAAVDEFNRVMMAKGTALRQRLLQLIGNDPTLKISTFMATADSPIGSYTRVGPLKSVITLALNAKDELSIADHEGYHYAEDRLLDARERRIVANAMKPGRPLYNQLIAKLQAYDQANGTNLTDEVSAIPAEARAYAFEFWRRGELQAEGPVARAFQIIRNFLEKVSNLVRGLGFVSLEDVFTALDRGQFAERSRSEATTIPDTELARQLAARANEMFGAQPGLLKMADWITNRAGRTVNGIHTTEGEIGVSLAGPHPLMTLNHEGFHHAMRYHFTGYQQTTLLSAFERGSEMSQKVEQELAKERGAAWVRSRQGYLYNRDGIGNEEIVAFGFQYWKNGDVKFNPPVNSAFQSLLDFLTRIANWMLGGEGARFPKKVTAEELFIALDRGQFAERTANSGQFSEIAGELPMMLRQQAYSKGASNDPFNPKSTGLRSAIKTAQAASGGYGVLRKKLQELYDYVGGEFTESEVRRLNDEISNIVERIQLADPTKVTPLNTVLGNALDAINSEISDVFAVGQLRQMFPQGSDTQFSRGAVADATRSAFDPTNPDIRFSKAGVVDSIAGWTPARVDNLLHKYAYAMDDEKSKAYAMRIAPQDFLDLSTPKDDVARLEREARPLSRDDLANEDQEIYLDAHQKIGDQNSFDLWGHEGRHRMVALRNAGVESVPVVLYLRDGEKRTDIRRATLDAQIFGSGVRGQRSIVVDDLIPISYANRARLEAMGAAAGTQFSRGAVADATRSAFAEMTTRFQNGELERTQLQQAWTTLNDNAELPDATFKYATGLVKAEAGGLRDWWFKHIATPNYVSRFSEGYKNVMNTLNTYIRYRKILAEQMLREKLPSWYKASDVDRKAAFGVMLKRTVEGYSKGSTELAGLLEPLTAEQRKLYDQATNMIEGFLRAQFAKDQISRRTQLTSEGAYEKWEAERRAQVDSLIDKGYVPLRRYGDYSVRVYFEAADGKRTDVGLIFVDTARGQHTMATIYQEEIARSGANLKVEIGTRDKNQRETGVSIEQFLGTLRRNGVEISQTERERLVLAMTNSESMIRNKMMHREGLSGYSEDSMRVLHEFGVNMSGELAYARFADALDAASEGRRVTADVNSANSEPEITIDEPLKNPDGSWAETAEEYKARSLWKTGDPKSGFYNGLADELSNYVLVPDHSGGWSRRLRAAAMVYFIGGSLSGAVVNMMSIPMLLVPELSIHTGYSNSLATTMGAWKDAWRYYHILHDMEKLKSDDPKYAIPGIDANLRQAIAAAADHIFDTEIHQMLGMSQGTVYSKSRNVQRAMEAWMLPFRVAEQTNRLASFIAAYRVATTGEGVKGRGKLHGQELFKFASGIVDATQNNYNESNRPGVARNPVFSLMFQFKSFPLFMTEAILLMHKQNPRSAVYMLLGLTMMTGVQGLPFAETILDLIDTISQRIFNSPFNARRALRNTIKAGSEAMVGADLSEVVLRGMLNDVLGVSMASRIGAGDFVPGSRIGTADADKGRVLSDMLGAPFAMVKDAASNVGKFAGGVFTGDWKEVADAIRNGGPVALRNLVKGAEQLNSGFAMDARGRVITDVNTVDGLLQLGGLSSAKVARMFDMETINIQTKAFHTQFSQDLQHQLVAAMKDGDTEKVQEINELRAAWNAQYPQMPIMANASATRRAIILSGVPLDQRSRMLWGRRLQGANIFSEETTE